MCRPPEDRGVPPKHVGVNELLLFYIIWAYVCFVKASMDIA